METKKEIIMRKFVEDIGGKANYNRIRGKWHANRFQETCLPNFEHFQDPKNAEELIKILVDEKFLRLFSNFFTTYFI